MSAMAIVYTSNTGFTAEYARLLSGLTGLEAVSARAAGSMPAGTEIIYMGWVMGGLIRGLDRAKKRFTVRAVCGVIMGASGSQLDQMRGMNRLDGSIPLFSLQGGFDMKKLRGVYRFMMKFMTKKLIADIEAKPSPTADDEVILDLLKNGGSRVSEENLKPVTAWLSQNK